MTSKEAFRHIIDNDFNMVLTSLPPKLAYNNVSKEEMISIIEKDLEVLELVKKYFVQVFKLDDFTRKHFYRIIFKNRVQVLQLTDTELTEKEYLLLKEWLEE